MCTLSEMKSQTPARFFMLIFAWRDAKQTVNSNKAHEKRWLFFITSQLRHEMFVIVPKPGLKQGIIYENVDYTCCIRWPKTNYGQGMPLFQPIIGSVVGHIYSEHEGFIPFNTLLLTQQSGQLLHNTSVFIPSSSPGQTRVPTKKNKLGLSCAI